MIVHLKKQKTVGRSCERWKVLQNDIFVRIKSLTTVMKRYILSLLLIIFFTPDVFAQKDQNIALQSLEFLTKSSISIL